MERTRDESKQIEKKNWCFTLLISVLCAKERQGEGEGREIEWKAIEWNGIGWCNITLKFVYQNYIANTKLKRCGAVHPIHIVCEWCAWGMSVSYIWFATFAFWKDTSAISSFFFFILFLCAHVFTFDGSINTMMLKTNNWGVPETYRLSKNTLFRSVNAVKFLSCSISTIYSQ